ncbi:MAG: HpcH/HpaI aldolase/citrate lyase family protein [Sciscionella sp.]
MSGPTAPPRSLLFVPGARPAMLAKVGRAWPDVVAVDLEDAVAAAAKAEARVAAVAALTEARPGAGTVLLRLNPPGTPWHEDDVTAAARACAAGALDGVVLPKYERRTQLTQLRAALPTGARVIVGLETALGVADSRQLLDERPDAAYFGAEDLVADIGGRRTEAGIEVLYARSQVCLAARLAGVPALDQAVMAVHDRDGFRADAERGRDLGYRGKICLHPAQVTIAHEVFTPSAAEVEHAHAVMSAANEGVALLDGQMVDAAHIAMARAVLARTRSTAAGTGESSGWARCGGTVHP